MTEQNGASETPAMTTADLCASGECPHVMLTRCPLCKREQYAPAVWQVSHGDAPCAWCGEVAHGLPWARPSGNAPSEESEQASSCSEWYEQGREPQEICPCGHYAAVHTFGTCHRCTPDDTT